MHIFRPEVLIIVAALGYAIATWVMKITAQSNSMAFVGLIALALMLAVAAEVFLLQRAALGHAYIAILSAETMLVIGFSFIIGEGLSPRELLGGVLVVAGSALVTI